MHRSVLARIAVCVIILLTAADYSWCQLEVEDVKRPHVYLSDDSSSYIKFYTSVQFWLRYTDLNPGSVVGDVPTSSVWDYSIRRFRAGLRSSLNGKWFLQFHMGLNNYNFTQPAGLSVDLFDLYVYYEPFPEFAIGLGKSAWNGLSRGYGQSTSALAGGERVFLVSPGLQITNHIFRRMAIFTKGQVGRFDYRFAISQPLLPAITRLSQGELQENRAEFARAAPRPNYSAYIKYFFGEKESNVTPFIPSTYFARKKILNLGAGFELQGDALWSLQGGDTLYHNQRSLGMDFFTEWPIRKNWSSLVFFGTFIHHQLGPNFIRQVGINNPANEFTKSGDANGGNNFPIFGTGSSFYMNLAYFQRYDRHSKVTKGFLPYFNAQFSDYEALDKLMFYYEFGLEWVLRGHRSKCTLHFQNRPVFETDAQLPARELERKWMAVLQYQFRIY